MSSPGGSYSNLWCSFFNADLALVFSNISVTISTKKKKKKIFIHYCMCSIITIVLLDKQSVAMTAASTVVSAAMLPVNLLIYINLAYQV
jgi:hypothetical protein